MSALYLMNFVGRVDVGGGVLFIGHGVIAGADVGEVIYDGKYEKVGGRIQGQAVMHVPKGIRLVTGQTALKPTSLQITVDWPEEFDNGQPQNLKVEGNLVQVRFHKIRDLP